jgi:hypothetical protein
VIQPETADIEREFGVVLEACFSQTPPTFIRTNDALHLGLGESRARAGIYYGRCEAARAAVLMGFTVLP